jgi:hypothetical protein
MMANKRVQFLVSFELPDGVTKTEALNYVRSAVERTCSVLDSSSDPMFYLDSNSVRVSHRSLKKTIK